MKLSLKKLTEGTLYAIEDGNDKLLGWMWKPHDRETLRTFLVSADISMTRDKLEIILHNLARPHRIEPFISIDLDTGKPNREIL